MRSLIFRALFPLLLVLAAPEASARGTLDSILPGIRASHPGRLSDAEPWTDSAGAVHYRIKWMTPEGRILYFDADTRTGRYSNAGGDNGNEWRGGRRGGRDDGAASNSEEGGHRGHWNGDGGDNNPFGGGGDWRRGGNGGGDDSERGGDWRRGQDRGGDRGGQDRGGDRGGGGRGDWHGGGGRSNGGGNGNWHGGGGHHHNGN